MKIERLRVGDCEKQEWDFGVKTDVTTDRVTIFLRGYVRLERTSKRHSFKPVQTYDASRPKSSARGTLRREYVHVPQDVLEEAKQRIVASMTFE